MRQVPYRLTEPIGQRATLGLVVLRTDETIEHDARRLCAAPDIALHVSRVPLAPELTPESIHAMERELATAAGLLPDAAAFSCVGYACTSGTAHIGAQQVSAHLRRETSAHTTSDPMSAAIAALGALGCRRIGLVSPYTEQVAAPLAQALEQAGLAIAESVSFCEQVEANVARIDPASILEAALTAGAGDGVDAVFLSCTNLRTLGILDHAEAQLGKPVVSSNQALFWHMLVQSGLASAPGHERPGTLMRRFPAPRRA